MEFIVPNEIRPRYVVNDRNIGGRWLRPKPDQVTDHTGMSLASGRFIPAGKGVEVEPVVRASNKSVSELTVSTVALFSSCADFLV